MSITSSTAKTGSHRSRGLYNEAINGLSCAIAEILIRASDDAHFQNRQRCIARWGEWLETDCPISDKDVRSIVRQARHLEKRDGSMRVRKDAKQLTKKFQ